MSAFAGTTSACAENTFFTALHCGQAGNYLRVRGEYSLEDTNTYLGLELPPRARRIPIMRPTLIADGGNYLRVRGEYTFTRFSKEISMELPPRARRIRQDRGLIIMAIGTTSACAENTHRVRTTIPKPRNYLRVRGEYSTHVLFTTVDGELPPRARRIPLNAISDYPEPGTTSACAENTQGPGHGHRGC